MLIEKAKIVLKFDNYNRLVDWELVQSISESYFGLGYKLMFVRNARDLDTLVANNTISRFDANNILEYCM